MATLEKIRQKGKLLAIIIGFALLAFILGDMIRSGKSLFRSKQFHVAVVNDKSIDINEFENQVDETEEYVKIIQGKKNLDDQTIHQIRASVWNMLIKQALLEDTYKKLGIEISKEELQDLVIGKHIHPLVYQTFVNPQTGRFDRNMVINVIKNLDKDPKIKALWLYIESYIKQDTKYTKYLTLVTKGLFANKLDAQEDYKDRSTLYDLDIVGKTITDIADNAVSYTEKDLEDYYNSHKNLFRNLVNTRDIEYISFDVIPSKADSAAAYKEMLKIKKELANDNDEQSIVNISSETPEMIHYYSAEDLKPEGLDTILFKLPVGTVYGPYFKNGKYNLVKIIAKADRPDTVSARHILISPQNPKVGSMLKAQKIADSLVRVLKNGGDFAALAAQYSDDPGSKNKGGLYENFTEGKMVPAFNDYCFSHKVGEIGTVTTQFGVHIIEVTKRSKAVPKLKLAFIHKSIDPSQNTYNKLYAIVMKIRGEINDGKTFDQIVQENNYVVKEATDITEGTYTIPGLENVRDVVKWAFKAKEGEVSSVFEMPSQYVIAKLKHINNVGYLSLDKVKKQVENSVIQQKKVEKIYKEYFTGIDISNLDNLAKKLGVQKLNVPDVSFNAFQIANIGYEPAVLGALCQLKINKPYGPIKGSNGVYVIQADKITPAPKISDVQLISEQKMMTGALRSRANYQAYTALRNKAKIIDRRANFF
jgi:peptidyl-prolyl cis-trans isomerase D